MTAPKRTRLSPHDRRMQLLDCAMVIIEGEGLSSFTMEALAKAAGVSNPLVYKYFDTRLELLQELLIRETERFSQRVREQVTGAESYKEMVTIVVSTNFEQFSSSNILNILRGQADVFAAVAKSEKEERNAMARFLVRSHTDQFTVSRRKAEEMVVLAAGASQAAAAHYNQYGGNRKKMIEDTVEFIFGGITALID